MKTAKKNTARGGLQGRRVQPWRVGWILETAPVTRMITKRSLNHLMPAKLWQGQQIPDGKKTLCGLDVPEGGHAGIGGVPCTECERLTTEVCDRGGEKNYE